MLSRAGRQVAVEVPAVVARADLEDEVRAQRGADAAAARALAQRRPVEGARAGDQGRADGRGRPVVTSPEEGGDAADVGGGGGGAGEEREPAPVGARRHRAQPAQGRGHEVGLHQRAGRVAAAGPAHHADRRGVGAGGAQRGAGARVPGEVRREPTARGPVEVDGGHRVQVGGDRPGPDVGQHHAGAPGLVDRGRLVDATDRAPRAHHDRAAHRAGVQRARSAQGGVRTHGAGSGDPGAQDDPGVPHGAPGDHRAAQLRPAGDPHVAARQRGRRRRPPWSPTARRARRTPCGRRCPRRPPPRRPPRPLRGARARRCRGWPARPPRR